MKLESHEVQSSHHGHVIYFIGLFLFGILFGYGVGMHFERAEIAENQPLEKIEVEKKKATTTPAASTTSTTTADKTADWKTYTDAKNGFSFKYPSAWYVSTKSGEGAVIVANFDYDNPPVPSAGHLTSSQIKRVISVIDNTAQKPLADFITSESGSTVIDKKTITVGEVTGLKYNLKPSIGTKTSIAYLPFNQKVYQIVAMEDQSYIDEMLGSLKFTK